MSVLDQQLDIIVNAFFSMYDKDNNNVLDPSEIRLLLSDSYKRIGKKQASAIQIKEMIKKYDKNRDGVIDRSELKCMMRDLLGFRK